MSDALKKACSTMAGLLCLFYIKYQISYDELQCEKDVNELPGRLPPVDATPYNKKFHIPHLKFVRQIKQDI